MKSRQVKLNHLSTNNKNFVAGSRIIPGARQDLTIHDDVLDENVRLERVRKGHHAERNAVQYGNRDEVIWSKVIEESRNGYVLTAGAPRDIDPAVKHFTTMLRKYTLDFPEEWAICHFNLGKIFYSDHRPTEDRCKAIENGLFHFKTCVSVFTGESYPTMWALACHFQASLYRERAMLIHNRDFTLSRGNATQSVTLGIEQAEEALNFLALKEHRLVVEQGFARMELGWLLYLSGDYQSDVISAYAYSQLLERSVSHLEKALSIFIKCAKMDSAAQKLQDAHGGTVGESSLGGQLKRQFSLTRANLNLRSSSSSRSLMTGMGTLEGGMSMADMSAAETFKLKLPSEHENFHHIRLMLGKNGLGFYAGMCNALLGASYFGLTTEGDIILSKDYSFMAYEYLSESLKQKYGLREYDQWVESRCYLASLILRDPVVLTGETNEDIEAMDSRVKAIDDRDAPKGLQKQNYGKIVETNTLVSSAAYAKPPDSSLAIEAALSHLNLARQNPISRKKLTEIHYMSGQANFAKLHFLSDKAVTPASFSQPMPDGSLPADVMVDAEDHYQAALKRVSAVSKNGIDAFVYFLCCLKIAELRVLQAVAINNLGKTNKNGTASQVYKRDISLANDGPNKIDRDYLFQSALKFLMDSLHCRRPEDNIDVHFLASSQMGYLLSIGPKREVAVHCFVRALFCMSCMIIRSRFFKKKKSTDPAHSSSPDGANMKSAAQSFFSQRHCQFHTLSEMAKEAQRLASMALLSSLKLVEWTKSSKTGEAKRSGFCLWSFEKEPPVATRIQTLTGSSLEALKRLKSMRSMQSVLTDPSLMGQNMYIGAFSKKAPHKPSDLVTPEKHTKNRHDNDSMADYQRANSNTMIPLSMKSQPQLLKRVTNNIVEEETEEFHTFRSPVRRNAKPMYDADGNVVDVPVAPSHIKAPELEYEDITVKKKVKKKVRLNDDDISHFAESQISITSMNHSLRGGEGGYHGGGHNEDDVDSPEAAKPKSFVARITEFFSDKHRKKMRKKLYKMANKSVANVMNTRNKFKESIASAELVKETSVEIIGTEHCVFGLMLLSHMYRQLLSIKVLELEVGKGARVQTFMKRAWVIENAIPQMKRAHVGLKKECENIMPCPWTLQGLSETCTKKEIRRVFKNQSRVSSHLLAEENVINRQLSRVDPFLPLVLSLPSYNRLAVEASTNSEFSLNEETILGAYDQKKSVVEEVVTPEVRLRREGEKTKTRLTQMNSKFQPLENFTTTPLGIPSGGTIGMNAVKGGEGRRTWASYLDSTSKGIDKLLAEHLKPNEALIQWHIFTSSLTALGSNSYPLQATVVWKEKVEDIVPFTQPGMGIVAAEILAKKAVDAAKKYGTAAQKQTKKALEKAKKLRNEALLRAGKITEDELYGNYDFDFDEGGRSVHSRRNSEDDDDDDDDDNDDDEDNQELDEEFDIQDIEKVFMEYARSDVDMMQIQFALQSWVDAIHSRPAPIRESKCTSALSLLSDCFSMTELLTKLPKDVDTLIICAPSYLSVVPWHLINVDNVSRDPSQGPTGILGRQPSMADKFGPHDEDGVTTSRIHLNEKFTVVNGHNLPILEINALKAVKLDHAPGRHKLCFVDADEQQELAMTNVEVGAVTSLWSADIWDYSLLEGIWASHSALSTEYADNAYIIESEKRVAKRKKAIRYAKKIYKQKTQKVKLPPIKDVSKTLKDKAGFKKKLYGKAAYNKYERENSVTFGTVVESDEDEQPDLDLDSNFDEDEAFDEDKVDEEEEVLITRHRTSKVLTGCRVIHFCALRETDPVPPASPSKNSTTSPHRKSNIPPTPEQYSCALQLPDSDSLSDQKVRYDAKAIVANLYLENCGLAVLSRVGVLDTIHSKHIAALTSSGGALKNTAWDLVEALHLSGAPSVVLPLWGGGSFGGDMGQLARLVLFIRFYFELPNQAHRSRPIARALQLTQLWMRETTVGEMIEFIGKAPLPEGNCEEIQNELEVLAKASCSKKKQLSSGFGDVILFDHFFYWGMLTMVGDGRGVHPVGVGGEAENIIDPEVQKLEKQRAKEEKRIEKKRQKAVQRQLLKEKGAGALAVETHVAAHEEEYGESDESDSSSSDDEDDDEEDDRNLTQMQKLNRELKWLRMEGLKTEAGIIEKQIRNLKRKEIEDTKRKVLEAKKKFDEFKVTEKLSEIKADIKEDLDEARAVVDKTRKKQTLFGKRMWKDGDPIPEDDFQDEEEMLGRVRSTKDILKSSQSDIIPGQESEDQMNMALEEEEILRKERERKQLEEENSARAAAKKKNGSGFMGFFSRRNNEEEEKGSSESDLDEDIFATPRRRESDDDDSGHYDEKSTVCVVM